MLVRLVEWISGAREPGTAKQPLVEVLELPAHFQPGKRPGRRFEARRGVVELPHETGSPGG